MDDTFTRAHDGVVAVIERELEEPIRRKRALEVLEELRRNDAELMVNLERAIHTRRELNLDYDSTRADFASWEAELTLQRRQYRTRAVALVEDLKGVLTTREWDAIWVAFSTELDGLQGWTL